MRSRAIAIASLVGLLSVTGAVPAWADAAKPGQSMTHMKTEKGILSTLEAAGVVMFVQGGATAAVIGDSLASPDAQKVFHIPVTGTKTVVEHVGSNIIFFNTANNKVVQLRNPVIDLKQGIVTAVIPQVSETRMTVLAISNLTTVKAKVTSDKKSRLRTTAYAGAKLSLAPGIAPALTSLLELPAGSLPEGLAFASADVTVFSTIAKKK